MEAYAGVAFFRPTRTKMVTANTPIAERAIDDGSGIIRSESRLAVMFTREAEHSTPPPHHGDAGKFDKDRVHHTTKKPIPSSTTAKTATAAPQCVIPPSDPVYTTS